MWESIFEILGTSGVIIIGLVCIVIGYVGSVMPALPGAPIALVSIYLLHFTKVHQFSVWVLVVSTVLALSISFIDYVVPVIGAKKYGGSKVGVRGSTVGLVLAVIFGFFVGPVFAVGLLILGPFLGAYLAEKYIQKTEHKAALKVAWGSLAGFLAGTFGKLLVTFVISIIFVYGVFNAIF